MSQALVLRKAQAAPWGWLTHVRMLNLGKFGFVYSTSGKQCFTQVLAWHLSLEFP